MSIYVLLMYIGNIEKIYYGIATHFDNEVLVCPVYKLQNAEVWFEIDPTCDLDRATSEALGHSE